QSAKSSRRRITPLAAHLAQPFPVKHRRNFRGLDFAATTTKNIGVGDRNALRGQMRIHRRFVFEEPRFIGAVRDSHDVDVAKLRAAFPPVTMRENVMPPDLAARFNLTARRHRPMKQPVESRYPHASSARLDMFQKSGKTPNDFAGVQLLSDAIKFFQGNADLPLARDPPRRTNFFRRELPFQCLDTLLTDAP